MRPSPYAEPLRLGEERLRGLLLVSPWAVFRTTSESHRSNMRNDYMSAATLGQMAAAYEPKIGEVYAEPLATEAGFWGGAARS